MGPRSWEHRVQARPLSRFLPQGQQFRARFPTGRSKNGAGPTALPGPSGSVDASFTAGRNMSALIILDVEYQIQPGWRACPHPCSCKACFSIRVREGGGREGESAWGPTEAAAWSWALSAPHPGAFPRWALSWKSGGREGQRPSGGCEQPLIGKFRMAMEGEL